MKKVLVLFLICSNLYPQISNKKINRWVSKNQNLEGSIVSIAIKELKKNKKIYGINLSTNMTPASNVKILTVLGSISFGDSIPLLKYKVSSSNDTLRISPTGYPLTAHPKYIDKDLEKFIKPYKHIFYHKPKIELRKYGPAWAWDDYNYYFQAERSEMPIYGNVIQVFKKSNGEIEIIPDNYKINLDFEQKEIIFREEVDNNYFINPSLIKMGDTLYSPFITSRKNTISLLKDFLNTPVKFSEQELSDYNTLNSSQVDKIYSAILKDSDNLISESLMANISLRLNDTISVDKGVELIQNRFNENVSNQIKLYDGSGLSRYNLITSKALILSLEKIYQLIGLERIKNIFPKNYILKNKEDFVWGKTGTLRNNHNYSGYISTNKNKLYVFSIMINHYPVELEKIKDAIADFLIYLKSNT
ncbi:MAG: hypothetical protein CMC57_00025 [Flavobacteriaceae bacterium]|nr:hypothetical protein [Flavobacteriaceae bacterium]